MKQEEQTESGSKISRIKKNKQNQKAQYQESRECFVLILDSKRLASLSCLFIKTLFLPPSQT